MRTLDSYIGIRPWTVLVDDSVQLQQLAEQARVLRNSSFPEKLAAVKQLTLGSMGNAYEGMVKSSGTEHERFRRIVFEEHPLSVALAEQSGCCRYQGALFFALAYEADLGDHHFLDAGPVNSRANTVFNRIWEQREGEFDEYIVSIFTESLQDKSLDYARTNPRVYEEAFNVRSGALFYSYHRNAEGNLVLVESEGRRINADEFNAVIASEQPQTPRPAARTRRS